LKKVNLWKLISVTNRNSNGYANPVAGQRIGRRAGADLFHGRTAIAVTETIGCITQLHVSAILARNMHFFKRPFPIDAVSNGMINSSAHGDRNAPIAIQLWKKRSNLAPYLRVRRLF
jgi:hypothetical protein